MGRKLAKFGVRQSSAAAFKGASRACALQRNHDFRFNLVAANGRAVKAVAFIYVKSQQSSDNPKSAKASFEGFPDWMSHFISAKYPFLRAT
jgi:hypothetical protein